MEHSFDVEIAKEYGVPEAIVLRYLQGQIQHNFGNDVHYHDGRYWTYGSKRSFCVVFPYMSYEQIRRVFKRLIDKGLVISGDYNETKMDRRLWYALTDYGLTRCPLELKHKCNGENPQMDWGNSTNACVQNHKCGNTSKTGIFCAETDDFSMDFDSECKKLRERENKERREERSKEESKENKDKEKMKLINNDRELININNNNSINNTNYSKQFDGRPMVDQWTSDGRQTYKRFVPPSVDEVRRYCEERHNNVDPEAFVDFYESKGWMVGKNKMKSWKAAVRTWERSRNNQQGSHIQTQEEFEAELKKFMEAEGIE